MKKFLSMLLAVLMVVGMFPMTAFAAEIPSDLKIVEITEATAFEEGEVLEFSKWGMEGYSAPSWIATVPAGTETVKITFRSDDVPTYSGKISGGWLSYNEETGTYDMGGKDLTYEEVSGGYAITLDVKSMIENGNYYVKYDRNYAEEYALGFKYAEEVSGPKITLSTDAESLAVGDKFAVTATLSGNEGFNAITLKLDWNDSAVEFTGFNVIEEDGEKYLDSELADVRNLTLEFNQDKGIVTAARTSDTTFNGVLFVANFEVISNGEAEISLKKEFPDFVFANAAGTETKVNFDETDLEGLGLVVPATSITLNKTELTLEEGGANYLLTATVEPSDSTDSVVFTSSDENVATVSKGGNVVSVKPGTATITATAGSVSAECVVTVTPEENIIKKTPNNYSDYVDAEMTGVKSIQFGGETLEVRNIYKVTLAGHEACYIQCSKSDMSNSHAGYTLDGTHVMGDATWGTGFGSTYFNGSYGYKTKDYIVSYDDLKAAVGEENMGKLGVTEEDKLAVLVFKKVGASFNYVILFDIDPVALEGISIDEKAEIDKGSTKELKVTFTPSGADEVVTWKSSDESVATVDENGVVTAVKNGKATITATAGEFSDTCEVTVRTSIKNIPSNGDYRGRVNGIYVSGVEVDGYEWEDKTLTVYVDKNTNATATVVFGWFRNYNQNQVSTYEVEVKNGEGYLDEFREYGDWVVKFAPTAPTTVLTVESEATVVKGHEKTLTATRNEDSTDDMSWSSSDESVATVDKNGKVRGISEGKATITVKSGDLEASCEVTVILVHAESVKIVGDGIENGKLRVLKGKQIQLSEVTEPAEHTDEIKWSSSNTEVLSVLGWAPGYFNAKAPGTSTVTVTVGEVSASIEVEVYEAPVEKITLDKTEATILNIETLVLNATTDPAEHTDGNIEWSSSDETVVTVSMGTRNSGTVTPVGVGEATVTAKVGNVSATCKVTVTEPEEGTVIWSYDGNAMNGWPQYMSSSYGIGALIMNGAKFDSVAEENGVYTVTLPHATAKDAEIALKVFACGATPNQLGVNWHEGEVNPQSWNDYANKLEHTVKLVDGEATLKIRAYKASGAGASREGTKTFKFVVDGECTFDQKVASEEHLAAEATCTEAATYYMSCVCGANGTETFSAGEALGHDWGKAEYKWAEDALSCTATRVCKNDAVHTESAEAEVTGVKTKEPTCAAMGDTQYTAKFSVDWAETQVTVRSDVEINPDAHDWGAWNVTKLPYYGEEGLRERECNNQCENKIQTEKIAALEMPEQEEMDKVVVDGKEYYVDENDSVDKVIKEELENAVKNDKDSKLDKKNRKVSFVGVIVGEFDDAGEFSKARATVTIEFPEGADKNDKFEVYVIDAQGNVTKLANANVTKDGIEVEVDGSAAFAVAYESVANTSGKPSKPSKPSSGSGITIIDGRDEAKEESNPNTGAPIVCSFDLTAAGVVVLAATAAVLEIKRRK
ncbi:MAG: Ig-like domain-containing protein [Oscillospiraceae bacterium]|nr:Ig-like domain-containing protein [Oscillospiraceae bacterium]